MRAVSWVAKEVGKRAIWQQGIDRKAILIIECKSTGSRKGGRVAKRNVVGTRKGVTGGPKDSQEPSVNKGMWWEPRT